MDDCGMVIVDRGVDALQGKVNLNQFPASPFFLSASHCRCRWVCMRFFVILKRLLVETGCLEELLSDGIDGMIALSRLFVDESFWLHYPADYPLNENKREAACVFFDSSASPNISLPTILQFLHQSPRYPWVWRGGN